MTCLNLKRIIHRTDTKFKFPSLKFKEKTRDKHTYSADQVMEQKRALNSYSIFCDQQMYVCELAPQNASLA